MMKEDVNILLSKLTKALIAENVSESDNYIALIASANESSSISKLLLLLDDNFIYDEIMYSLIHAAEGFDDPEYVAELLEVIPALCKKSPKWASIVIMRSLNSDKTRAELVSQLRSASNAIKSSMDWLLSEINKESSEFLQQTVSVLIACKSS